MYALNSRLRRNSFIKSRAREIEHLYNVGKRLAGGGFERTPGKRHKTIPSMTPSRGSSAMLGLASAASNPLNPSSSISNIFTAFAQTKSNPLSMGGGRGNVINRTAARTAKKITNSRVLKKVKGKRKVRVSSLLRKKIKQVIQSKNVYGEFHTVRHGNIGIMRDTGFTSGQFINMTMAGYGSSNLAVLKLPDPLPTDFRILWSCMTFNGTQFSTGYDWLFFNPLKVMDAASILWNQKVPGQDYTNQTGNFQMKTVIATGAPVAVGTAQDPQLTMNTIHVVNSFVQLEFKNLSNRGYHMKIYLCVPKQTFSETTPLSTFYDSLNTEGEDANTGLFSGTASGMSTPTTRDAMFFNPQVPLKITPTFNAMFSYETVELDIAPFETVCHSIQGPKNMDYDYNKFFNGTRDQTGKMWKKSTVAMIIELVPDLQWAGIGSAFGRILPPTGSVGPPIVGGIPNNGTGMPIVMEVRETFKLTMPDNVGFIGRVLAAGNIQMNNLKYNAKFYANWTNSTLVDATNPQYSIHTREDPVEATASSVIG